MTSKASSLGLNKKSVKKEAGFQLLFFGSSIPLLAGCRQEKEVLVAGLRANISASFPSQWPVSNACGPASLLFLLLIGPYPSLAGQYLCCLPFSVARIQRLRTAIPAISPSHWPVSNACGPISQLFLLLIGPYPTLADRYPSYFSFSVARIQRLRTSISAVSPSQWPVSNACGPVSLLSPLLSGPYPALADQYPQ